MTWKYYEVATPAGLKVVIRTDLGYPIVGEFTLSEELTRGKLKECRAEAIKNNVTLSRYMGGRCYRK